MNSYDENTDLILPGLPNQFVRAWYGRAIKLWTPVARPGEGCYTTELIESKTTSE